MKVGSRLMLAVVPAILGVFTVAALAFFGERYRAAPGWLVLIAGVASVLSLVLAWRNTRYVARRITKLAGPAAEVRGPGSPIAVARDAARPGTLPDEMDSIEEVVDRLSGAVSMAEAAGREQTAVAEARTQEYAALLAETATALARHLDEVRLSIHILLESHFGTLNENQEELLAGARAAMEAADVELRRLKDIAEIDRGALNLRRAQVRVSELLLALRPQLQAVAERVGATLAVEVAPGLPRVAGDRVRLQEALELLLTSLVRRALPESQVKVTGTAQGGQVTIAVEGAPGPTLDADVALARRVILAHGGGLEHVEGTTRVTLPSITALPRDLALVEPRNPR